MKRALFLVIFVLSGLLAYRHTLQSDFIFDDNLRIATMNPVEGEIRFFPHPILEQGLGAVLAKLLPDRPLLMFTIWLNFIWGGADASGYKLVNVLLHVLVSFLLFLSFRSLSRLFSRPSPEILGAAAALLFLLHPINSQAVNVVIQRGVLLSAVFALLALLCSLKTLEGESRWGPLLAPFFFICGLLAKSNILPLPLIVAALAWASGKKGGLKDLLVPMGAACAFPVIFYLWYRDNFHAQSTDPVSWLGYGLVQSRVIFHYLRQVFLPYGFHVSYPIPGTLPFSEVWPFCLSHLVLFSGSLAFARKGSLMAAGLVCFYLALLPESSFFPIPHFVFDHRMYFPLMFLLLSVYSVLAEIRLPWARRSAMAGLLAASLFLGMATDERNYETRNYLSWIRDTARSNPADWNANSNFLYLLFTLGRDEECRAQALEMIGYRPADPDIRFFLALYESPGGWKGPAIEALSGPAGGRISHGTRTTLLQRLILDGKKGKENTIALEETFALLMPQVKYFRLPEYAQMARYYEDAALQLYPYYAKKSQLGGIAGYEREILYSLLPYVRGGENQLPLLDQHFYRKRTTYLEQRQPGF